MMTEEEKTVRANALAIVNSFNERFRETYGEGHLLMACHAAFPIAITPDMLYQLWANFRDYNDPKTGLAYTIDRIAVSDVLLWHCWQEVDLEVYELDTAVRACLLDILRNDVRFGEERLRQLAQFLHQYTDRIIKDQLGESFREVQKWAAMATLAPAEATKELSDRLTASVETTNEPEVLRLRNVLEALTGQQERFRGMLYISKALKAHYLGYGADTINQQIDLAKGQRGYGLTEDLLPGEPFFSIPIPADVPNEAALPAKPVSKLYILAVGIDEYKEIKNIDGCVNDAHLLIDTVSDYSPYPIVYKGLLLNEEATKTNILDEFGKILQQAESTDVVVFTFSGHGSQNSQAQRILIAYGASRQMFGDRLKNIPGNDEQLAMTTITEAEFREFIRTNGQKNPHILFIIDAAYCGSNWLDRSNPKHILFTSCAHWQTSITMSFGDKRHGVFTKTLVDSLYTIPDHAPQTYYSLYRKIYQAMQKKYEQNPQLIGTEKALQRPFLSTDDSGNLYINELIRYGTEETDLAPNQPGMFFENDRQAVIDQLVNRFPGVLPKISETNAIELLGRLQQAITTSAYTEGLPAICIGSEEGLSQLDQLENNDQLTNRLVDLFIEKRLETAYGLSIIVV